MPVLSAARKRFSGRPALIVKKMKTANDPRHKKREATIKNLFAYSFLKKDPQGRLKPILGQLESIDQLIRESAPEWPIDKLNKVDLAILRLALWEFLENKVPKKVVIDEAVELAKEYGSESSPKFVNGVLGTVLKKLTSQSKKKKTTWKNEAWKTVNNYS